MAKRLDRVGSVYGKWTVTAFHSKYGSSDAKWMCRCECGTVKPVIFRSLSSGSSTSCGCDAINKRVEKLTKHGFASTPTYKSWYSMLQRCAGKGGHEQYVSNGVTVCKRWHDFNLFLQDMGVRPENTTLDRINNAKGYFKENCRWATAHEQMNNRACCKRYLIDGCFLTVTEAARKYNVGISMIRHRLRAGWSFVDAVKIKSKQQ